METFCALLVPCAGNSPLDDDFPAQLPVTRSFFVFFHLRLHKRLSKQSSGWSFETPSRWLWRHGNGFVESIKLFTTVVMNSFVWFMYDLHLHSNLSIEKYLHKRLMHEACYKIAPWKTISMVYMLSPIKRVVFLVLCFQNLFQIFSSALRQDS